MTACYWHQTRDGDGNGSGLLLQQYVCRGVCIHFSCVCRGQGGDDRAGGYMTEQLLSWFRGLSLKKLVKRRERALERAEAGLRRAILQTDDELAAGGVVGKTAFSGIFCVGEEFFLFSRGEQRSYLINTGLGRVHIKRLGIKGAGTDLTESERYGIKQTKRHAEAAGGVYVQRGVLQPDVGLLFASAPFWEHITEQMLREGLSVREVVTEEQMRKHLNELGAEARRQGAGNLAAVFVRTARGDAGPARDRSEVGKSEGGFWDRSVHDRSESGKSEGYGWDRSVHDRSEVGKSEGGFWSRSVHDRSEAGKSGGGFWDRSVRDRAEAGKSGGDGWDRSGQAGLRRERAGEKGQEPKVSEATKERQSLEGRGYIVRRLLGQGAFSRVYGVEEQGTGRRAACKISENLKLFKREERILKKLRHQLFPEYYGSWQEGDRGYLLMEEILGENLASLIKRGRRFSVYQVAETGMELAEGLLYLHESLPAILFRDVKPDNIMLRRDGRVKLLDFGCACEADTDIRERAGTPGFAAPEQLCRGGEQTGSCDVYGLGRTLQELLGAGAHDVRSGQGRLHGLREGLREHMDRGRLEKLLTACVEMEPSARPADMRVMAEALFQICASASAGARQRRGGHFWQKGIICEKNIRKSTRKTS